MTELRIKAGLLLPTCSVDSSERGPEKEVGVGILGKGNFRIGGEGNSGTGRGGLSVPWTPLPQ